MNLFDLINRRDRSVAFDQDRVVAVVRETAIGNHRFVDLAADASIHISSAHQFSVLSTLTANLGWSIATEQTSTTPLSLTADCGLPGRHRVPIPLHFAPAERGWREISIDWPSQMALAEAFDLTLTAGPAKVSLVIGPAINFKRKLLAFAQGRGIEVGPGITPQALPSEMVDVTYIEAQDPREWRSLYLAKGAASSLPPDEILARYRRASACELDGIERDSLDFIFSSHVFEHLSNPLQVLCNWFAALRPGGLVLSVVPDARFCFDCRQRVTTLAEALHDEQVGGHAIEVSKYERWCEFTNPNHKVEKLIATGYSIHVSFFTPEALRPLLEELRRRGIIDHFSMLAARNHKDFGFLARKSRSVH
jgi:SAM-dependent methyltransferase